MKIQYTQVIKKLFSKSKNGDAIKIVELLDEDIYLFLVADGVGGCVGDYKASETVVEEFCKNFKENRNTKVIKVRITNAIETTNKTILNEIGFYSGMKSTLVAAILDIKSNKLFYVGIGDSRIYNIVDSYVSQLTKDQVKTIVRKKQDGTPITVNGAVVNATGVTNVFGIKNLEYEINEISINKTQAFLLASDGFYSKLSGDFGTIKSLLKTPDLEKPFELIAKKVFNQQDDDSSAIFLRIIFENDNSELTKMVKIPELLLESITTKNIENTYKYLNLIDQDTVKLTFAFYDKAIKALLNSKSNDSDVYQRLVSLLKKAR